MRYGLIVISCSALAAQTAAAPALSYFPLTTGATWVRRGDDGGQIAARVAGPKTVGAQRCVAVETKSVRDGQERTGTTCYLATAQQVLIVESTTLGRLLTLEPPRPLMLLPPAAGKSWSWSPRNAPVEVKVTDRWLREETVRVPAGAFKAWMLQSVTQRGDVTVTVLSWYAPGVGLVKVEREASGPGVDREGGSVLVSYRIP